jgi:phospholipid/cholesterol/gamma-HCH transport system substrate-binding protein
MSLKANYFKLGLFVVGGAIAAAILIVVIGSGRWFQPRITIETYFNESVQGLDIGSKVKYRGVVIGDVTRISFTYTRYQLEKPMSERMRYVLVEAQLQAQLLGGRTAAGDLTNPQNAAQEVERGLRVRIAPQGITGTNYLEIDYVNPDANVPLPIDWQPIYAYIPSSQSTVTQFVNAASEIVDRLHKLDVEGTVESLNRLLATLNDRVGGLDTRALSQRSERVLAKVETTLDALPAKQLSQEAVALLAELRQTNNELRQTLQSPALKKLPDDAATAIARMRTLVEDPNLPRSLASLSRTLSRFEKIFGGGEADLASTIENLRQITDNLRDLTEDAKRYPSNVIFGAPPQPVERPK